MGYLTLMSEEILILILKIYVFNQVEFVIANVQFLDRIFLENVLN